MKIGFATTDKEIMNCLEVVQALRPHITDPAAFLEQIKEMTRGGYRLLYGSIQENGKETVVAFAGFRELYKLFNGRSIYIDDLSTLPAYRGKGYGSRLLDHIHQLAKEDGRTSVELDSGFHRHDAHRLYLNKGYKLATHHFSFQVGT